MKYLEWFYKVAILVCLVAICSMLYDARKQMNTIQNSIGQYSDIQKESEQKLMDHISKHFKQRRWIGDAGSDNIGNAPSE